MGNGISESGSFLRKKSSELTPYTLLLTSILSNQFTLAYDGDFLTTYNDGEHDCWNSHALYLYYDPMKTVGQTLRAD
jgi:hypothetical protein